MGQIVEDYFGHPVGGGAPTNVPAPPTSFRWRGAHPNPFNPRTEISFELSSRSDVTAIVYDVRGERVATLQEGPMKAGPHRLPWNGVDHRGSPVASGVYVVKLIVGNEVRTTKVALVK